MNYIIFFMLLLPLVNGCGNGNNESPMTEPSVLVTAGDYPAFLAIMAKLAEHPEDLQLKDDFLQAGPKLLKTKENVHDLLKHNVQGKDFFAWLAIYIPKISADFIARNANIEGELIRILSLLPNDEQKVIFNTVYQKRSFTSILLKKLHLLGRLVVHGVRADLIKYDKLSSPDLCRLFFILNTKKYSKYISTSFKSLPRTKQKAFVKWTFDEMVHPVSKSFRNLGPLFLGTLYENASTEQRKEIRQVWLEHALTVIKGEILSGSLTAAQVKDLASFKAFKEIFNKIGIKNEKFLVNNTQENAITYVVNFLLGAQLNSPGIKELISRCARLIRGSELLVGWQETAAAAYTILSGPKGLNNAALARTILLLDIDFVPFFE